MSLSGPRPIRSTLVGSRRITLGSRCEAVNMPPPVMAGLSATAGPSEPPRPLAGTTGLDARTVAGRAGAPVEQLSSGPSAGCPSRTVVSPSRMIFWTFCDPTKVPLVLPVSSRTQEPLSSLSTACCHDTRSSLTTMSDFGSRPMVYEGPAGSVRSDPWARTASGGALADSGFSVPICQL